MMTGLTFDEATHTYRFNGVVVPSVTQILKGVGLIDENRWATDWHMTRGRYIHKATELWDQGRLDMDSVDPEIAGYVQSYILFRATSANLEIKRIESRVHHELMWVAGTLDREIALNGCPALLDIKSGQPEPWHGLQLSGYALCCGWEWTHKRFGLYLKKDGSMARLEEYTDPYDDKHFFSALDLFNWKNQKGNL